MDYILSLLCNQRLELACSYILGDGNCIHKMKDNLQALRKEMQDLKDTEKKLKDDVSREEDKGLKQLPKVQTWFLRVAEIESEVNVLLEAESTEIGRLCLFGYCSNGCISSCKYGRKVSKKLEEVKELLSKQREFKEVADKGPVPKVKKQHIQTETTVGLDSMVEKAWNSLMKGEHTKTLGLYGMGGVGKTTLLKRINNKFAEEVNDIDVVIWVEVSKELQNESIQNQILGRFRIDKEWEQETEKKKAESIDDILSRKKFVLLLDGLWSEVALDKIGVPHPTRHDGAKIVFTTRLEEVCKKMKADKEMKVECLSFAQAWELFQKIVGEDIPLDCQIPAKKIVEKCDGLPLALNVIGKAMTGKEGVRRWLYAVGLLDSSSHKFPGMEEEILPILKFSYDGIRDENVKSCFLYCSLFPENYEISKEELIEYWICEGFVDGNRDEDGSNNHGHDIIGSLVCAHLLMDGEVTIESVKMHDVVRKMALWIGYDLGEGKKNLVKSGAKSGLIPEDIDWEVERISLMSNQIKEIKSCPPECPKLSTLLLSNNDLGRIADEFFQFMPALVVLDLSKNKNLRDLPDISSLTSLQYLNLSRTRIRSLQMKGLGKLISLDLENTLSLSSVDGIGESLPNLQVLKLYHSGVCIDAGLMQELQLLEHLKILTATVKDALILECIQGIKLLASCLQRLGIEYITEQAVTLNAVALGGIRELTIGDSKISEIKIEGESKEKEERLCPTSPVFKHLSTVSTNYLEGPKDLTWLLHVPNLRDLTVRRSSSIEEIINGEEGMSVSNLHPEISLPFQKLERLRLENLDEVKRICSNIPSLPKLRQSLVQDCPKLRQFVVQRCPKLPKAATEFTSASGSNDITEVRDGDELVIEAPLLFVEPSPSA